MCVCTRCSRGWKIGRSASGLFIARNAALRAARQSPLRDAMAKLREVREEPLLVLVANRPILLLAPLAPAQDVDLLTGHFPLDDHARLLLGRLGRRRLTHDLLPTRLVLEVVQVLVALALPARHQVMVAAPADLCEGVVKGHGAVDPHGGASPASRALL